MSFNNSIILGIVQGISEFLPISSSGHLTIAGKLLGIKPDVSFDVLLHLATLLAVCIFFLPEIIAILTAFLTDRTMKNPYFRLGVLLITASIPTAIIGFAFKDAFEAMFTSTADVGFFLILSGIMLLLAQVFAQPKKDIHGTSFLDAVLIGIAQGCAIAPGLSRSGTTISASLLLGLDRPLAARFAFLLSIPAILGASALKSKAIMHSLTPQHMAGFVAAAISGYLAIFIFVRMLEKNNIRIFAYYCFIMGLVTIFIIK